MSSLHGFQKMIGIRAILLSGSMMFKRRRQAGKLGIEYEKLKNSLTGEFFSFLLRYHFFKHFGIIDGQFGKNFSVEFDIFFRKSLY